jgi:hypothetical protein
MSSKVSTNPTDGPEKMLPFPASSICESPIIPTSDARVQSHLTSQRWSQSDTL